jgi:HD-like signal output (HDOD) protein
VTSAPSAIVQRLHDAINQHGEFPGMAKTLESISLLTASEGTSSVALADAILQDYGLTQKVLRMVNTVAYAQREPVTTVTRAVVLMGFERIRDVASGLLILEHLQKQARTAPLIDALGLSFFSASLARNLALDAGGFHAEEAFIAGLFHRLGKLLLAFYLPKDYERISWVEPAAQDAKAREVFGMTFSGLGTAIAQELNLPQNLIDVMQRITATDSRRLLTSSERLACLATLANDLSEVLASGYRAPRKRATADRLLDAYGPEFAIKSSLDDLVAQTLEDFGDATTGFGPHVTEAAFLKRIVEWHVTTVVADGTVASSQTASPEDEVPPEPTTVDLGTSAEAVLTRGLVELTNLLGTDFELRSLLEMMLETIYRGLGPGHVRVFLLLLDPAAGVARFRVGFGQAPGDAATWAEVPIKGSEDLFSLSLTQQKDLVIRDARSAQVAQSLPRWFTKGGVPDRFMVMLPVVVKQNTVGLVYLDGQKEHGVVLTPGVLGLLKVLRGETALAIAQKARGGR